MALPASSPISLSQVNVELSRAAGAAISLNESAVRTLAGVPSGTIAMQDLRGKSSAGVVSINNQAPFDVKISPDSATATYSLTSAGSFTSTGETGGNWLAPQVGMDTFEVRATLTSGTLTSGTTGSFLSLGTTREWTIVKGIEGIKSTTLLIEIRKIGGDGTILDSATISMTAEVLII